MPDPSPAWPGDPARPTREDERTIGQAFRSLLSGRLPAVGTAWPPLRRVRVSGHSMEPTFGDGDWLLVGCWLTPGDGAVVLARDPRQPRRLLVKRVRAHPEGWWLTGDNPAQSTDSRVFGVVSGSAIEGVVIGAYRRSRRPDRPAGPGSR